MMLMTSECVSTFDLHPARNLADMVLEDSSMACISGVCAYRARDDKR